MRDEVVECLKLRLGITETEVWHKPDFTNAANWLRTRKEAFSGPEYAGSYLLVHTADLSFAIGKDLKEASMLYCARYGDTPKLGRSFIGQQL